MYNYLIEEGAYDEWVGKLVGFCVKNKHSEIINFVSAQVSLQF